MRVPSEVRRSAIIVRHFAGECLQPLGACTQVRRRRPCFAACGSRWVWVRDTQWKFPLAIPARKLAPALAFGAVVWKPAEAACGLAALLATALTDAGLPPGSST
ncbi:MAG TPA: aldehyde dehydrogenase family protein [Solirubrobacteraceae bacterium]|nr:aldehyde dehydrogenase family protein [Solirubrobacteraceae bacterium]